MEEKSVLESKKYFDFTLSKAVKPIVVQLIYFFAGLLVSRGAIFGSYSPFGAALVAAVPYTSIWSVLAGGIIGYILPSGVNGSMRYIASIIAVVAIRWTLSDLKKVTEHPLYAPMVAMLPILATGIAMSAVDGFSGLSIVMTITESFLAAGASYFFARTVIFASGKRGITTLGQQEIACIAMSCCIMLLAFAGIDIKGISLGRVISVLVILFCARYGGVPGGSIAGISTGILFSLSSPVLSYISGAYSFAGLMAGLFSPLGRVGSATAFIVSNAIVAFQTGDTSIIIAGMYEVMAATLIFMIIPRTKGSKISAIFLPQPKVTITDGIRDSIVTRLNFASKALLSVSDSVEKVSEKLSKLSVPDIKGVYQKTIDNTCHCCALRLFCWEKEYDKTMAEFDNITPKLKKRGNIIAKDFSDYFNEHCCKIAEIANAVNRYYDEFSNKQAAERRMNEVRGIISEQFLGTSEILKDMAQEFEQYDTYDSKIAEEISAFLKSEGIVPIDVSCFADRFGRLSIEMEIAETEESVIRSHKVTREISKICDRAMDTPCISNSLGRCMIHISEKPVYSVEVGTAQHICNNGRLCGDNYDYFNDGLGRDVIVLSDGMGTGGKAAVDGAMAAGIMCDLAKAGINFDCALRIVNSALLIKAGEESLATLDITCIDKFTGKVDILKAGAPFTFIRKGETALTIDAPSLPAGILKNIEFSGDNIELGENDYIVMVSDGVLPNSDNWVEGELEKWEGTDPQKLANYIVEEAIKRREDGYDDDVTALVIKIVKV